MKTRFEKLREDHNDQNSNEKVRYGYIKDPDDKHHWIVDEVAADVVRDIFKMCVAGKGPSQIAKALSQRQIPVPTVHLHRMGINTPAREPEDIYAWQQRTIADILIKKEYLGHQSTSRLRRNPTSQRKRSTMPHPNG